jgi:predicted HAD superfamily Cof-like phosphohydrolase
MELRILGRPIDDHSKRTFPVVTGPALVGAIDRGLTMKLTAVRFRSRFRAASRLRTSLSDAERKVRAFHLAMGVAAPRTPIGLAGYPGDLRCALIAEEVHELTDAFANADIYEAIDAICDILYVAYGAAVAMGESLGRDHPAELGGQSPKALYFDAADVRSVQRRSQEYADAWSARSRRAMLSILTELVDDLYRTASNLGVDIRPFFEAVHMANMAKEGGPLRADGKVQKPPGWRPPDIAGLYRTLYGEVSCDTPSPAS